MQPPADLPDPEDDPIAPVRRGLVSRSLVWKFIVVFSVLAITAVVIAFHDKDPIAERRAAEEEKRRQQQANQAQGNPSDLGKIFLAQAEAGKAARETAPRPSDAALAALAGGPRADAPSLDMRNALMPGERNTESYRQRRDAVAILNLPIYLDDREPHRADGGAAGSALRGLPASSVTAPGLAPGGAPQGSAQLDALYRAMAAGSQGGRIPGGQANEDWLRSSHGTEQGPVFAQPALIPRYTLRRGSIIPAVTVRGLNSDLPGQITVQVTQDVYDTATGHNLLIPKGTRLVGPYNADVVENQERLLAAFQQLIFLNGATVNLPGMPASDLAGNSGVPAEVDSHFWRIFGSSFLVAGLARLLIPDNRANNTVVINAGTGLTDAAGQVLVDTAKRILDRNQHIRPTLTFGYGEKLNVEVTRDLVLPPEITGLAQPPE
jgi:type IV secretion system protein VirB10